MTTSVIRSTEAAFAWTEALLGGKIVSREQHERWRPQWFLDVETAGGVVPLVMRGFRNPGYASPDETHARATLKFEADVLRYLQALPVRVPKFYGHNTELGWLLMERVPGESELTEVADTDARHRIFREYLEDLAVLHSQPLDIASLPPGLDVPADTKALIARHLDGHEAMYRAQGDRPAAEPLFEFGLQWLRDNPLTTERPMRLGLCDVGPNQFIFGDGHYRSLLDFEFTFVADPLLDIALMRCREMAYPIGRLGDLIEHYGAACEGLTGEPLDRHALKYWTVYGCVLWPLLFNRAIQHPDPDLPDQAFLYAFEGLYRRAIPEALAEYHCIALDPPNLPEETDGVPSPLHELLVAQLEGHFTRSAASTSDRVFATSSAALAKTLARADRYGSVLERENLDELEVLLGSRPANVPVGLRLLEALIADDYRRDFAARVRFFHRFELRREFLQQPLMAATGCAAFVPLAPLIAD